MAVQKIFSQQIDSGGISNGKVLTANSASNTAYWATPAASGATWAALIATNTAIRALDAQKLQVANAVATYQTKSVERAALANTNLRIDLLNTNLTGTNTAIRSLDTAKLSVANAVATYLTKSNPVVTGTLTANGSVGTSGYYLRTSGAGVYWSPVTASGGGSSNSFSRITVGANTAIADGVLDTLTFVAGSGITIAANPTTDTITFASTGGGGFTNGQSISVANLVITGALTANGGIGTAGQVLTSNGSNVYWSTKSSSGGSGGGSVSVIKLITTSMVFGR